MRIINSKSSFYSIAFIVIFIHSIFILRVNAQENSTLSFQWGPSKTIHNGNDSLTFSVLSFKNASYDYDSGSPLPYYEELLPVPSNEFELTISIEETDFFSIPVDSLNNISGLNDIGKEIKTGTNSLTMRKQHYAGFQIYPYKLSEDGKKLLLLKDLKYNLNFKLKENTFQQVKHVYASKSVLSSGTWHKLKITESGIHKITYNDLKNYGVPVQSVNPEKIQIYGNGGRQLPYKNADSHTDDLAENAIYIKGESDGSFDENDYILFYAEGPHVWSWDSLMNRFTHNLHEYDNEAYYFLTYGQNTGERILQQQVPSGSANAFTSSYDSYKYHEKDSVNLIKSGRKFYGNTFDIENQYTYNFTFSDLDPTKDIKFRTAMAARHTSNSQFILNVNGKTQAITINHITGVYTQAYARASIDTFSMDINQNSISFNVMYQKPASQAKGWMDYIEINARENLIYRGKQLDFRDHSITAPGNIAEYSMSNISPDVKIWDVTNPLRPQVINTQLNGNTLTFKSTADTLRQFVAHENTYHSPQHVSEIPNQNLHGLSQADMIIITHPNLSEQSEELAKLHADYDNMVVHVVEPQRIYNEFSSGQKDISALRNFVRMFYDRASSPNELPRYLLLMGDGNYDPKNRNDNDQATILTFQSSMSLSPSSSYVTDDFFGMFDPEEGVNAMGSLDIGVGRIPVGNTQQAKNAVKKIKRYMNLDTTAMMADIQQDPTLEKTLQGWRNTICFIADDEDNNLHIDQANEIANKVQDKNPSYVTDKIFFDAYQQINTPGGQRYPEATKDINEQVQKGALIMNYIGHGGVAGLAEEEVLRISDINSWNNKYNLPVFMTATCEFSRFDDPERVSAGEYVFLNPDGGAISMYTTTRLAWAFDNYNLNLSFYRNLFNKQNGEYQRMGDLMREAKVQAGSGKKIKNFVLFGDPALQIAFPEKQVITTKINAQDTSITDTLQALSTATVSGIIADENGNIDTTFNGIIYPTVYDKKSTYSTLGQDPKSHVYDFKIRDNILYKGKASVQNGEFSFSFVIPKDIAYNLGKGKIVYYAENGITDANGYYDNFMIGGTSDSADTDNTGPEISLYINDFNFKSGDLTDENPILLAKLFDENGINTVGNGIGHDIIAILDKNTSEQVVLNDYYEADLDDYKRGTVRYPYENLSEGKHTLTVKVWDVYNNSSSATIEFVVTKSEEVTIENLSAYPNPSTGKVWFTFDHNQARQDMNFQVEIFSLDGRLMQRLSTKISPDGYSVSPIQWNGRTQSGARVEGGMYIYRARLTSSSGISKQKSGKLVILN